MPLTISPVPILRNDELRVNADGVAEKSQDEERNGNAQDDWNSGLGVCKIRLDTLWGFSSWQCLE